jgi:hypothetical protein
MLSITNFEGRSASHFLSRLAEHATVAQQVRRSRAFRFFRLFITIPATATTPIKYHQLQVLADLDPTPSPASRSPPKAPLSLGRLMRIASAALRSARLRMYHPPLLTYSLQRYSPALLALVQALATSALGCSSHCQGRPATYPSRHAFTAHSPPSRNGIATCAKGRVASRARGRADAVAQAQARRSNLREIGVAGCAFYSSVSLHRLMRACRAAAADSNPLFQCHASLASWPGGGHGVARACWWPGGWLWYPSVGLGTCLHPDTLSGPERGTHGSQFLEAARCKTRLEFGVGFRVKCPAAVPQMLVRRPCSFLSHLATALPGAFYFAGGPTQQPRLCMARQKTWHTGSGVLPSLRACCRPSTRETAARRLRLQLLRLASPSRPRPSRYPRRLAPAPSGSGPRHPGSHPVVVFLAYVSKRPPCWHVVGGP